MTKGIVWMALVASTLTAPGVEAQELRLGGFGGLTFGDLYGDDVEETESRTAATFGALLQLPLGGGFSLQPEVAYAQRGATALNEGQDGDVEFELDYLDFSAVVLYDLPTEGPVVPHFGLGGALGFELSCDANGASCADQQFETSSADFSLLFGAGVDIESGPGALQLDGRLGLGLTGLDDSGDDEDVKGRTWVLRAGYSFNLGSE